MRVPALTHSGPDDSGPQALTHHSLQLWNSTSTYLTNNYYYDNTWTRSRGLVSLILFGTRYYNPTTANWTQPDPAAPTLASDPKQAGAYSFAGNDPINATDPTGFNMMDPNMGEWPGPAISPAQMSADEAQFNWLLAQDDLLNEAASKVPASWGPGVPSNDGNGWRWMPNKSDYVRVDLGNPDSSSPSQQVAHVHITSGGKQIADHLPLREWLKWKHWNRR